MESEFDIASVYRRLLSGWHWILGAALVGGLVGFLAWQLRPPLYEASAVVGIGIDRNRADVPDDITIRQAYDRVRGLVLADDTLQRAAALAAQRSGAAQTGEIDEALRDRLRLTDRSDGWVLAVLGTDPMETEQMAQAWADASIEQLQVASVHALRAAEWQDILYEASCRLVPQDSGSDKVRWLCRSEPDEGTADSLPASLLAEVEASRGILPVFTYSLLRGSGGTAKVIVWSRGSLILGSALAGMAFGGLAVATLKRSRPG